MFCRCFLMVCAALPLAVASAPPPVSAPAGPPTQAEALKLLKDIARAAEAKDPAPILDLLADDAEIKSTLRLGASERRFVHTKQELTTELPALLAPAEKPRASCRLLSLTRAGDDPTGLLKFHWEITLRRPDGELRVEATGGALIHRAEGRLLLTRANQLIQEPRSITGGKVAAPHDSPTYTRTWRPPVPKKAKTGTPPEPPPPPKTTDPTP